MKTVPLAFAVLYLSKAALGQSFVNLDFESAQVSGYAQGDYIPMTEAIPGWIGYSISPGSVTQSITRAYYNTQVPFVDAPPQIFLQSTNSVGVATGFRTIQGGFSIALESSWPFGESYAAIGQTGKIPTDALSLTFLGLFAGHITFSGHPISYIAVGNIPNGNFIYVADISSYAGQTGELLFATTLAPSFIYPGYVVSLDSIQFSTQPVPEPSALILLSLSGLFLCSRRRKRCKDAN